MKFALPFTVFASLSIPGIAQTIAAPGPSLTPLTAATAKILNDQDADAAAANDMARPQPPAEAIGTVEIPTFQTVTEKPVPSAADGTAQPTG